MSRSLTAIPLVLLASACTVGNDYAQPGWTFAGAWQSKAAGASSSVDVVEGDQLSRWWKAFHDPKLDELIEQASNNNRDLKIAMARVSEARAFRIIASAPLYPTLNAGARASRGNQINMMNNRPLDLFQAAFDASWEVDLFGGTRRREEAATQNQAAREAEQEGVLLSLRAEVARNYIELRTLQAQQKISEDTIRSLEEIWKFSGSLETAGLARGLDVAQAEAEYHATASRLPQIAAAIMAIRNQLAVLLGVQPHELEPLLPQQAESPVPVADTSFVMETPAAVIARRPDVAQAEHQLASATALSAAAIADRYPKINLGTLFGWRDTSKAGPAWSLGGSLVQPLFNAGSLGAGVDAADARQEQALNAYEQQVLQALADVETALSNYLHEEVRHNALVASVKAAKRSLTLAKGSYREGLTAFIDVLNAQRTLYTAQSSVAESAGKLGSYRIALMKAIGR